MNEMNKVSQKILEDAKNEANEILKNAKKQAEEIIKQAKDKVEIAKKQSIELSKQKYKETYQLKIMQIESEEKRKILQKKLEIIDEVIDSARKKLIIPEEKQLKKYFENIFSSIDIKDGEILLGNKEKIDVNLIIKEAKKYKIKLKKSKEKSDFDYGIKIISGKVRYEISPVDYINTNKEQISIMISKDLFAEA